jgi:hypothetical protein
MMKLVLLLLVLTVSCSYAELYRWKDDRGTVHYCNNPDDVPTKYRSRVKTITYGPDGGSPTPPPGGGPVSTVGRGTDGATVGDTKGGRRLRDRSRSVSGDE